MSIDGYEPLVLLLAAAGAGLLVGLQREQSAYEEGRAEPLFLGGVRTYPLYALAGGLSTLLAREFGGWIVVVTFAALTIPLIMAYRHDLQHERDRGLTSEAAFVLTFLCGVLALSESIIPDLSLKLVIMASVAIGTTALLSLKEPLHQLAKKVSRQEIYASLKFLVVAIIVMPLLPDKTFGPLDVLNPFHVGLMIVLMAGISFVGYVAIRLLGAGRGLGLTGLVGGLVSSTAVTLSVSGRAKKNQRLADACALAVVLASTIMLMRVLIEVAAVNRSLLPQVVVALAFMMVAGLGASFVLYRKGGARGEAASDATEQMAEDVGPAESDGPQAAANGEKAKVKFRNPFELGQAVKFGLLFAVVLLVSKAAETYLGHAGLYLTGVLAGLTDMDAITLSMARLADDGGLDLHVATTVIMLAAMSNTCVKGGMAYVLGGGRFARIVLTCFAIEILAGALGIGAVWLFM